MFCSQCGTAAQAGSHFCGQCGASLLAEDVTSGNRATTPMSVGASVVHPDQSATPASAPTRKQQLQALKLELKRLKLELREMENLQLLQPQQRKQALQQHIFRLEEQILALESQPI